MSPFRRHIHVLVVDDSAIVRKGLSENLRGYPEIDKVTTAPDAFIAYKKLLQFRPQVIVLDVQMPGKDGITFLRELMREYPTPVIIFSAFTPEGSALAMEALDAGAVDVVAKPSDIAGLMGACEVLAGKIRFVCRARFSKGGTGEVTEPLTILEPTSRIFAIGASTGGVKAIETVLSIFPANGPGTVIVQHMPGNFTPLFANSLDRYCAMRVREARQEDVVEQGTVLVAPGGFHLKIKRGGEGYQAFLDEGEKVNRHKPSVDVLFNSVAECAGGDATGVLLTGMGKDGAKGLLNMRRSGALTIAQSQDTCAVYGMPMEAIKLGAANRILPLGEIGAEMIRSIT